MKLPHDHELKFLTDAAMYLALKHEAEADDRALGGLLRHICHLYLQQKAYAAHAQDSSPKSGLIPPDHDLD